MWTKICKWLAGIVAALIPVVVTYLLASRPPIYTYTYNPPEDPGVVYVVVNKKGKSGIYLAYEWGPAGKDGTINVAQNEDGLVLRLMHPERGSYPLTIKTNGKLKSDDIRQYQDDKAPDQWKMDSYKKVYW
jgi:hypothetical protein